MGVDVLIQLGLLSFHPDKDYTFCCVQTFEADSELCLRWFFLGVSLGTDRAEQLWVPSFHLEK